MKRKVLIIDDEKFIAETIGRKLEQNGYESHVAYDGKEGFEIACSEKIDLIVTDVVMPVMDGYGLCKKLQGYSSECSCNEYGQ